MTFDSDHQISFLVFSASLREGSINSRLARLVARAVQENGSKADLASMREFDCPSFDQDQESAGDFPPGAQEFRDRLEVNDAFIVVSPEYNFSMPGLLKNAIDWVSRYRPQPFNERHGLLMSASPSMAGGNRGLWSLRVPLEHLGARIYPDMFSLASAHKAFDEEGQLQDLTLRGRFEDNIAAFMSLAEAAKNYPCIKRAWVEFLGERSDAAFERVE